MLVCLNEAQDSPEKPWVSFRCLHPFDAGNARVFFLNLPEDFVYLFIGSAKLRLISMAMKELCGGRLGGLESIASGS